MKKVDKYQLEEVVGAGSYGKVYRSKNTETDEVFAIKCIPAEKFKKIRKLSEFTQNEILVLEKISHPNIVRFVEKLTTANNFYMVYEFCAGGTLEKRIYDKGHLSEDDALQYFSEILSALALLDRHKIMHRDIKPSNIMLHDNKIKVGDFGFCKPMAGFDFSQTMVGSPIYMAPEILKGQNYDSKADVWSLGVMLYEMFFGRCPYEEKTIEKLIALFDRQQLKMLRMVNPISTRSEELLRKMLVVDARKRSDVKDIQHFLSSWCPYSAELQLKYNSHDTAPAPSTTTASQPPVTQYQPAPQTYHTSPYQISDIPPQQVMKPQFATSGPPAQINQQPNGYYPQGQLNMGVHQHPPRPYAVPSQPQISSQPSILDLNLNNRTGQPTNLVSPMVGQPYTPQNLPNVSALKTLSDNNPSSVTPSSTTSTTPVTKININSYTISNDGQLPQQYTSNTSAPSYHVAGQVHAPQNFERPSNGASPLEDPLPYFLKKLNEKHDKSFFARELIRTAKLTPFLRNNARPNEVQNLLGKKSKVWMLFYFLQTVWNFDVEKEEEKILAILMILKKINYLIIEAKIVLAGLSNNYLTQYLSDIPLFKQAFNQEIDEIISFFGSFISETKAFVETDKLGFSNLRAELEKYDFDPPMFKSIISKFIEMIKQATSDDKLKQEKVVSALYDTLLVDEIFNYYGAVTTPIENYKYVENLNKLDLAELLLINSEKQKVIAC